MCLGKIWIHSLIDESIERKHNGQTLWESINYEALISFFFITEDLLLFFVKWISFGFDTWMWILLVFNSHLADQTMNYIGRPNNLRLFLTLEVKMNIYVAFHMVSLLSCTLVTQWRSIANNLVGLLWWERKYISRHRTECPTIDFAHLMFLFLFCCLLNSMRRLSITVKPSLRADGFCFPAVVHTHVVMD